MRFMQSYYGTARLDATKLWLRYDIAAGHQCAEALVRAADGTNTVHRGVFKAVRSNLSAHGCRFVRRLDLLVCLS